jgi:hypothetical protein
VLKFLLSAEAVVVVLIWAAAAEPVALSINQIIQFNQARQFQSQ